MESKKILLTNSEAKEILAIGKLLISKGHPDIATWNEEVQCEHLGKLLNLGGETTRNYLSYLIQRRLPKYAFDNFCNAVNEFQNEDISKVSIDSKSREWLENFHSWKFLIKKENENGKRKEIKEDSISKRPLKINTVQDKRFINSTWYGYERKLENGTDKILKTKFRFGNYGTSDLIDVLFFTENSETAEWKGKAFINHTDTILSITLTTDQGSHYLHFLFRIETRDLNASLWVGHKTYSTEEYGNIVSKTVILQKEGSKATTSNIGIIDYKSEDVPKDVAEFLSDKQKNRMSSPHGNVVISSLDKLVSWADKNRSQDLKFNALFGSYNVYYKINNKEYVDSLIIEIKNKKPHARYTHLKDNDEVETHEGEISINFTTKRLTLFLHGPLVDDGPISELEDNRPLILILQIPTRDTKTIELLTGIITGSKDNDQGIVARLTMLVKCDKETELSELQKNSIEKYFKLFQNQSKVRPPKGLVISKFKELNELTNQTVNSKKKP